MPPRKRDLPRVRGLWSQGLTDLEIASRLGWDPGTVRSNRDDMDLPPAMSQSQIIARQWVNGLNSQRTASLARSRRDLATSYGLPPDIHPTQVAVIVALSTGPRPARELVAMCGKVKRRHRTWYHVFDAPTFGGNYLTMLLKRGLIAIASRNRGSGGWGGSKGEAVYMLTPEAMDMLASVKEAS